MMKFIAKLKSYFSFNIIRDLSNYSKWISVIKEEKSNPLSKYNKFDFSNNIFYVIYTVISLKDEEKVLPEEIKKMKVLELMAPINRYLDEDLGFADYLVPEVSEFYDENNLPTLKYGLVYKFAFKRLSLKWVLYRLALWISIIVAFNKFNILELIKGL